LLSGTDRCDENGGNRRCPKKHTLMIHGLVDQPLTFTMDDLKRFPSVSRLLGFRGALLTLGFLTVSWRATIRIA
jgi:hypothetical protein